MNRRIKFRVYSKEYNYFITPENSGYLSHAITNAGKLFANTPVVKYELDEEKYIVQQFTGLFDKNGKEIYEGDLIKFTSILNGVYEVIYKDYYFDVRNYNHYGYNNQFSAFYDNEQEHCEIVGNICQNADLIKIG